MKQDPSIFGLYYPEQKYLSDQIYTSYMKAFHDAESYLNDPTTIQDEVVILRLKVEAILTRPKRTGKKEKKL